MLYLCCKHVILHTVADDEAKLQALDLDAQGLTAHGYAVISDTERAVVTPSGELEWVPLESPIFHPMTAAERKASEIVARFHDPFNEVNYEFA